MIYKILGVFSLARRPFRDLPRRRCRRCRRLSFLANASLHASGFRASSLSSEKARWILALFSVRRRRAHLHHHLHRHHPQQSSSRHPQCPPPCIHVTGHCPLLVYMSWGLSPFPGAGLGRFEIMPLTGKQDIWGKHFPAGTPHPPGLQTRPRHSPTASDHFGVTPPPTKPGASPLEPALLPPAVLPFCAAEPPPPARGLSNGGSPTPRATPR